VATTFTFRSADGTSLRGWANDGDGVPLVISNGLGTIPQAWPALVAADSGYDAVTWYYRGTFGSERPADRSRIRVEDHVDDLVALMDARGIERALVACWSIGVNIGFEMTQRHPDRVGGCSPWPASPGGTFATMGGPLRIPRRLRHPIADPHRRGLRVAGPADLAGPEGAGEPAHGLAAQPLRASCSPAPTRTVLVPMLDEFVKQDWAGTCSSASRPPSTSRWTCPSCSARSRCSPGGTTCLTSMDDVMEAAARIPHAHITVLPAATSCRWSTRSSVHAALDELARRSDLAV
jgi:pimeloyl-ACP methyl ester carboxylesterase